MGGRPRFLCVLGDDGERRHAFGPHKGQHHIQHRHFDMLAFAGFGAVDPDIAYAKLKSLSEGAALVG